MLTPERKAWITERFNVMGAVHKVQPLTMEIFGIYVKGIGLSPTEINEWQSVKGFNDLTPDAQTMFRDIFGDQKFAPE